MFLRFEPIAPYANLSLALIVLLVKPHLLPLVTTWDDLFPGMDWTQPEYFLRRPDQDHAYASVYLVLYGVFGVCAQYCSIAMGEKTGITYSAYTGQQSNRGMPGAATAHKLIFGLYHLTLAALELVVFSTAAETITGTVAERASSARYTAAKVSAASLGALWLAMSLHFLCTTFNKGLKTCLDMVSFAYTCAIFTVWALGLLGATSMVTLVSAAGCTYLPLLFIVLQYASVLSCRCRPGPAGKPQPPAGWRARGLL